MTKAAICMCMLVTLAHTSDQDRGIPSGVNPHAQTASIASAPIKLLHNLVSGLKFRPIRTGTKMVEKVHDLLDSYFSTRTYTYRRSIDSDGDGIYDLIEAGHNAADTNNDRIIDGAPAKLGTNGLFDGIETAADSDEINSTISNCEITPNTTYDAYELDSDGDGCFDTAEADISDSDEDGIAGTGTPSVLPNGLIDGLTYTKPSNSTWQDHSTTNCSISCESGIDSDGDGIGDDCDLDDDNDGIPDLAECPSTASGLTGPLMTFTSDISSTDPQDPTVPHILNSITHNGNTYTDFLVPKSFKSGLSLTSPSSVVAVSNSTDLYSFSSNPNFETDIIDLFNSRDLGKYLELDGNNFSDGDYYELFHDSPIVTTLGGYIAITERNGNNRQVVQAVDADGNLIGSAITIERAHYVNQGVTIDANGSQNSWIALYPLEDLAPLGTLIFGLRVSFSTNNTYDGPDAKVFIFGDAELLFCDADNDGIPNQADLDSDNDGIYDLHEAGHAAVDTNNDGIIDGAPADFGTNGLFDGIETAADNGTINYAISDSESAPDGTYDAYELDSDGDGCFDTTEELITDSDEDGIAGTGTPNVSATTGLVNGITYSPTPNNSWTNHLSGPCISEICGDNIDNDADGKIDEICAFTNCDSTAYIISRVDNSHATPLQQINIESNAFVFDTIGIVSNTNHVNGIGYRIQDNFIYGIRRDTNILVRIDANANELVLGPVNGLPGVGGYNAGDVFSNGYLYVKARDFSEIYQIDVTSSPPSVINVTQVSENIKISDFAFNALDNKIYAIADNGSKYMIDPESGGPTWVATRIGDFAPAQAYGAAYTNSNGDVFVYGNSNGNIYRVDFGLNGTGTGELFFVGSAPKVNQNDGASCRGVFLIPEICNNGIDDDGDGNIDYLDSDCDCISGVTNSIKLNFSNHTNTIGTGLNLGDQILYENTSILEGRSIDIIATVISLNNITALDEHQNTSNINALVKIPSMNTGIGTYYSADIRYDLVESGTTTPITASFEIEIQDLDKRGNRTEYTSVTQSESDYYYLSDPTNIVANFNGGLMTMEGSQDQSNSDIEGSVKFVFIDQNSFTLTYGSHQDLGASTGAAGFSTDGNEFSSFPSCLPTLEDCTNGIDDDGDGFIDCADGDCPSANAITRIISN